MNDLTPFDFLSAKINESLPVLLDSMKMFNFNNLLIIEPSDFNSSPCELLMNFILS